MLPYVQSNFSAIKETFERARSAEGEKRTYDIGAYGSGLVCNFLLENQLVEYCWLAQSTGWPEYNKFKESGEMELGTK